MKTNKENIFAAGDIVTFPLFLVDNEQANVQHWQMAHTHGNFLKHEFTFLSMNFIVLKLHVTKF